MRPQAAARAAAPAHTHEVVVARQPIVDRDRTVVGFELLYRPVDAAAPALDGEQMTAQVVLGALSIGVDQLVGDKAMFCNAERGVLVGDTPVTLPPERTVIEVLETVVIDDESVAGCRDLVERGYAIALDDFRWVPGAERLLELASIVKIDLLATPREEAARLVERCRAYDVRLLAEKVETDEDVAWASDLGFELFQGYAIERPEVVRGATVAASALTHVQLALTLLTEELELEEVEAVLRREPGLVVQVLQLAAVGSHQGLRRPVRTVREALVLMGTVRIRQWVALTVLAGQPGGSVDGLAEALVRARACELAAAADRDRTVAPEFAFTAGLISALDLLLGLPREELEDSLGLDPDLSEAAFVRRSPAGRLVDRVVRHQRLTRLGRTPTADLAALDGVMAQAFAWAMPYVSSLGAATPRS